MADIMKTEIGDDPLPFPSFLPHRPHPQVYF